MKSNLTKFWLALLLALSPTISSYAYDFKVDGICYQKIIGSYVSVTFSTSTSTTGGGYTSDTINIPDKVTYGGKTYYVMSITDHAFYKCSQIKCVNLPNIIEMIGGSAFEGCTGLTSIRLPNNLDSIGDLAFHDCI